MNFEQMKSIESELSRLKESARFAGEHGASWWDYLLASHESLSKAVGRGAAREELQPAQCYELARAALFAAWARGANSKPAPATPAPSPAPASSPQLRDGEQKLMFNVCEAYR